MNANRDDETRRINCPALRTLHALERTLRRHIEELMKIDCEDGEAAAAIVFAIESAEWPSCSTAEYGIHYVYPMRRRI